MVIIMKTINQVFFITLLMCMCHFVSAASIPFPMPEGYFVKAKMPMHLVYPRSDAETQAHARHRWAHPAMAYEIPIGVQGGAWPFKYELIKAPAGAKMGSLYGENNYGSITWTPTATSGEEEFVVRITDQELKTVEARWKVKIDPSMFVFVKAGATGTKTGSITSPLSSIADWYKSPTDNSFHNKIIVFRGGNYNLVGDPADRDNLRLLAEDKTPSWIGFPGEEPIIDASTAKVMVGNLLDMFVSGITFKNARQDVGNAHYFWLTGNVSRATFWRNHFRDMGPGLVGADNTGPVFISSTTTVKTNILYKENNHTGIENRGYNGHYLDVYRASYVLVEQNNASNSNSAHGFWMKATVSFVSVRANTAYDNVSGGQITVGYGGETIDIPHSHEICWNRVAVPSNQDGPAMLIAGSNSNQGISYNTYLYRNTIVNGISVIRFMGKTPFETDANVIITSKPVHWNLAEMKTTIPNVVGSPLAGLVSGQKSRVTGSDFGKVGADVAVISPPAAPTDPKSN